MDKEGGRWWENADWARNQLTWLPVQLCYLRALELYAMILLSTSVESPVKMELIIFVTSNHCNYEMRSRIQKCLSCCLANKMCLLSKRASHEPTWKYHGFAYKIPLMSLYCGAILKVFSWGGVWNILGAELHFLCSICFFSHCRGRKRSQIFYGLWMNSSLGVPL